MDVLTSKWPFKQQNGSFKNKMDVYGKGSYESVEHRASYKALFIENGRFTTAEPPQVLASSFIQESSDQALLIVHDGEQTFMEDP